MFRTLIINDGEYVKVKDNWLVITNPIEEHKVPIEDIYCVVIDNQRCTMTLPSLTKLTESGVHILLCDEKHIPVSTVFANNRHYRPLMVIKKQLQLPESFKDELWKSITSEKLRNQGRVLNFQHCEYERSMRLFELANEVLPGDPGNREGIGAKWYFRSLFGSEFLRFTDDGINHALNYGYTIIRSCVAKTLSAYGYNCVLGLHHINEYNPFNLADDLMEPLRPLVDMWVDENHEDLVINLSSWQRKELINLVNVEIECDHKIMKVRNAVDKYVSSLTSAINMGSVDKLRIPTIIPQKW